MENFADLQGICLKAFDEVARTTLIFILPLFLGRIVFSNVLGDGGGAFTSLKGVVIYFLLIAGFPIILDILFSIPESFLPKFSNSNFRAELNETSGLSLLPFALDKILEAILALLYWVAYYLHIFFMILMCSMAPIIFLTSTLLGVGLGLEVFLGLLIIGSSWPIVWYGFDQVHLALGQITTDPFATKCLEILVTLFKGLAPVTLSSLAIKCPAGQIVSKSTKGLLTGSSLIINRGASMSRSSFQNVTKNTSMNSFSSQSRPNSSHGPGLRKVEIKDFERLLGDRFRKAKEKGSEK